MSTPLTEDGPQTDSEVLPQGQEKESKAAAPFPFRSEVYLATVPAVVLTILMVAALFMPWVSNSQGSQSLSTYGAPEPTLLAWALLALGTASTIVAMIAVILRAGKLWYSAAVGGLLYFLGAVIWYGASILPSTVASGCNSNGGPLCNVPATSPTLHNSAGAGFILGIVASFLMFTVCLVIPRLTLSLGARQSTESQ